MPEHSVDLGTPGSPLGTGGTADVSAVDSASKEKPVATEKPIFTVPDFGADSATGTTEDVLSPKEQTEKVLNPKQEQ